MTPEALSAALSRYCQESSSYVDRVAIRTLILAHTAEQRAIIEQQEAELQSWRELARHLGELDPQGLALHLREQAAEIARWHAMAEQRRVAVLLEIENLRQAVEKGAR